MYDALHMSNLAAKNMRSAIKILVPSEEGKWIALTDGDRNISQR